MTETAGGFPDGAFDRLAATERGHYWFESRNRLIVWAMQRYFPNAATLLELGCGTGFVLQGLHAALPQLRLTASDPAPVGLRFARSRVPSASFLQQDARALDAHNAFDVVGAFDVLEHIPEDEAVLARMHRAVRPGGGVLITVPQHPRLWSRADEIACHVRRYRRHELVGRVRAAGFDVLRTTSFVSLLLPVLAVSRWLGEGRESAVQTRELRVSPFANAALAVVLAMERELIRRGVSWPAGGSLLVVGRKPHDARGQPH